MIFSTIYSLFIHNIYQFTSKHWHHTPMLESSPSEKLIPTSTKNGQRSRFRGRINLPLLVDCEGACGCCFKTSVGFEERFRCCCWLALDNTGKGLSVDGGSIRGGGLKTWGSDEGLFLVRFFRLRLLLLVNIIGSSLIKAFRTWFICKLPFLSLFSLALLAACWARSSSTSWFITLASP